MSTEFDTVRLILAEPDGYGERYKVAKDLRRRMFEAIMKVSPVDRTGVAADLMGDRWECDISGLMFSIDSRFVERLEKAVALLEGDRES